MNKLYPAIAAIIIVALFVFLGLSVTGVIPGMWEILASPLSDNTEGNTDIAAALKDLSKEQREELMANITQKNVDGFMKLINRSENLTWTGTTTYYGLTAADTMTSNVLCYFTKDKSRADSITSGKAKVVITANNKLFIKDDNSGENYTGNIPPNYIPEQELGIPYKDEFSDVQKKDVRSVKLDRYKLSDGYEFYVVYLEFVREEIGSIEKYWISLDYGVVLAAKSEIDGTLTYSFKTLQISDNTPLDVMFEIE